MRSAPLALSAAALLAFTSLATVAMADGATPEAPPPAATPTPAPAPVAASWCTLGETMGVDATEAQTATRIVCGELWRKLSGRPAANYRTTFGKLGSKVVLGVESTDASGARDERHIELNSIEETSVAAPRLAAALVDHKTIAETEGASNVVGSEARAEVQKQGRLKPEFGVVGIMPLNVLVAPAPGLYGQLSYFYDRFVLGGGLRFAANGKYSHVAASVGGDFHFTADDVAPFAGGGFAWTYQNLSDGEYKGAAAHGFGAFLQVGLTVLRSHRTNFRVGIRGDIPFYLLEKESYNYAGPSKGQTVTTNTQYVVPLSLTVGMTF